MLHLLDTNILIALFAGEIDVRQKMAAAEDVAVPSIVLGELYFGAQRSARIAENTTRVDDFASSNHVLPPDAKTASFYGIVKARLLASGRPILENDIWIGALGLQYQAVLVTRDAHFTQIEGLATEAW